MIPPVHGAAAPPLVFTASERKRDIGPVTEASRSVLFQSGMGSEHRVHGGRIQAIFESGRRIRRAFRRDAGRGHPGPSDFRRSLRL